MAIQENQNKFHATITEKDRYNFKIHIPEEFRLPREIKKPSIISFNTGSDNPSERLFNIEYPKIGGILDKESLAEEIIISKKIAEKLEVVEGDVLEIKKLDEKDKTIFFCSDTTKNEPDTMVKDNLKKKMQDKEILRP